MVQGNGLWDLGNHRQSTPPETIHALCKEHAQYSMNMFIIQCCGVFLSIAAVKCQRELYLLLYRSLRTGWIYPFARLDTKGLARNEKCNACGYYGGTPVLETPTCLWQCARSGRRS